MKKNRNKGKKSLTAVGAVVAAAGLAPGAIAAVPAHSPILNVTAAEVVAIDGNTYSFDELYAMQQPADGPSNATTQEPPQVAMRYGVRPSTQHQTLYGVKRPQKPVVIIEIPEGLDTIQNGLMECCALVLDADPYTRGVAFTLDSELTRELEMSEDQLKALKAEIANRYGVEVSHHRFRLAGQLNTLRLISEYIYKIKNLGKR